MTSELPVGEADIALPIGEADIALLVDRFYAKVRRDPMIGPIFNEAVADWDEHLATLRAFWSSVMLTSGRYKGNPLVIHMRQPIRPEFFDRWLTLFGETAEEVVGGDRAVLFRTKANRIAESLKLGLFFRPGQREAAARPQDAPQPEPGPGPH